MRMNIVAGIGATIALLWLLGAAPSNAADVNRGAQLFRACGACHSLEAGRNLTGPSLADLWGRKAGALASFRRYSPALKDSAVVWDEKSLDRWLADPRAFIAGNLMTFPGIKNQGERDDLIAYLKTATAPGAAAAPKAQPGMGGMMGAGREMRDLKKLAPDERVTAIGYCGDSYRVTTADGKTDPVWEFNLRFKTDSSELGPKPGAPAYIPASMMGDRGFVIFADPAEFAAFIRKQC